MNKYRIKLKDSASGLHREKIVTADRFVIKDGVVTFSDKDGWMVLVLNPRSWMYIERCHE